MRLSSAWVAPWSTVAVAPLLVFLVLLSRSLPAAATQARPPEVARGDLGWRRTVTIVLAGGAPAARAALIKAFHHSLGRSGIELATSSVVKMNPAEVADSGARWPGRVIMWLDLELGPSKVATIYVTEGHSVFTRRLSLPHDFDAVALDLLDVVVTNAAEAVLAGKQLGGVPREEFKRSLEQPGPPPPGRIAVPSGGVEPDPGARPPPEDSAPAPSSKTAAGEPPAIPPPEAVPSDATASRAARAPGTGRGPRGEVAALVWSAAAVYSGALLAATQTVHGPGVVVDVQKVAWRVGAEITNRFPYETTNSGTTVRLSGQSLRVSVARLFPLTPPFAVATAIGLGADLTNVRTVGTGRDATAAPSFWALDPAVRSAIGLESRHGKLRMGLAVGLDIDLVAPRYVVARVSSSAGASQPLWVPWRWRPYATLTVGFTL